MNSTAVVTMIKMLERVPASIQERAVEHMREYMADVEDEALWDEQFARSQLQLSAAAREARQQTTARKAQ